MKGLIFTEFLEMVESKFGFDVSDRIITKSNLPSKGIYTSVGTYDFSEMVSLITNLHIETKLEIPLLIQTFGEYLFNSFSSLYPHFFEKKKSSFDFLENLEEYIHVEVLKLYSDAQLPRFEISRNNEKQMVMVYYSSRKLSDLAIGLLRGCFSHFNEKIGIERKFLEEDGTVVEISLSKV
ncbi:MAG: heme NO-binding domain-containing protein [Bacteroidales bacterium]|nr:heme NO-binding domain-containing protein [Bacteroidales bacterium]MCF8458519.1 heme NO-binding domain-containing protein [Bacteroidales bacterium]